MILKDHRKLCVQELVRLQIVHSSLNSILIIETVL